tara:strand:- start:62 stop:1498 length:1437 start_codon:yes stop_codon:yes gene_type:complete
MVKTDSEPVSEDELEEESDIEEIIEKDSAGYGNLNSVNDTPQETNYDEETYVGKPAPKESETYIQERKSYSMMHTDQNKLKNTKIGDHINYYENGVSGAGVVTKMSGQIIQVYKDDGNYYNLSINDTFHVSDILVNKTWNAMDMEERTTELLKIKAYSPRFLSKTWEQLPRELVDVMKIRANRGVGSFGGSDLPQGDKTPATATAGTKFFDQNGKQHATKEEADAVGQKTGRNLRTERATRDAYNADTRQTIGQRTNVNQSKDVMKKEDWDKNERDNEERSRGGKGRKTRPDADSSFSDHQEALHDQGTRQASEGQGYGDNKPIDPKKQTFAQDQKEFGQVYDMQARNNPKLKSKISKAEWDAMKSSIEDGALGNTGNSPTTGVSTKIPFDASPDYEGASHAKISPDTAFDYENVKPEVSKEPQAPKVDKDEQGIVKTGEFVYSDKPNQYRIPQPKTKGSSRYGIRYGVKYINKEDDS